MKSNLSDHLIAIILSGSRARGDAREHSDYDFLVIVDKKDRDIKSKIVDVEVETLDRFEKLTSSLVWEEKDWELKKRFPIGLNILKEGVFLYDIRSDIDAVVANDSIEFAKEVIESAKSYLGKV